MTDDSEHFRYLQQLEADSWTLNGNVFRRSGGAYLPLYEGKMFHHFDHRFASYGADGNARELSAVEKLEPHLVALPRYWITEQLVQEKIGNRICNWLLCWRKTAPSTNERTIISAILPPVGTNDKAPLLFVSQPAGLQACFISALNSFVLDFVARTKVGATEVAHFIMEQLPVVAPSSFIARAPWTSTALERWIVPRVAELCCTAFDMQPLAEELGYAFAPFRWDDGRRERLRAELDAAFFHLYGILRDDVDYVMETFPIVRRKDERAHGEYRTKRLILERYDALAAAIASGVPYETVLDPPPAHPSVACGPRP